MRIHSPDPAQPKRRAGFAHSGQAWQVTGGGVRPILIRRLADHKANVSRLVRSHLTSGPAFGFGPLTSGCLLTDLFATEAEARHEFARRQSQVRSSGDRRRLLAVPLTLAAATP